jgi:hypothetical protein
MDASPHSLWRTDLLPTLPGLVVGGGVCRWRVGGDWDQPPARLGGVSTVAHSASSNFLAVLWIPVQTWLAGLRPVTQWGNSASREHDGAAGSRSTFLAQGIHGFPDLFPPTRSFGSRAPRGEWPRLWPGSGGRPGNFRAVVPVRGQPRPATPAVSNTSPDSGPSGRIQAWAGSRWFW